MDLERNVSVRLEVKLPIEIVDQPHDQFAEDLHEERIVDVEKLGSLVLEVHGEERTQVNEGELSHNFEGLMAIDGLNDAGDVVYVPAEGFTNA